MNLLKLFVNLFHFNRTNWKAVMLCFLAAAIFWIFNALNKTYSTSIRFPLQFEFDQNKFAPAGELPQTILINVKGTGWDLFRKYVGVKVPRLTIQIERPAETRKIVASTLPVMLASQMGNIQINHVVLDTIRLNIEPRIYRKFPLAVDTTALQFKGDFGRTSRITITPDSVDLSGPVSVIHDMPDPIYLTLPERRIGANVREEVEVQVPDAEFVQRNPPTVEVSFEVDEFTRVEQKLRVETSRLPWGFVAMSDSVNCTFTVPSKLVGKFTASELFATLPTVSNETIRRGEVQAFSPVVHGMLPFIGVLSVDSVKVKHF